MPKPRIIYFSLVCFVIVLGLASRHMAGIPLFVGDILWAAMIYFGVRMLLPARPFTFSIAASLLFCYAIEFSQLYHALWIDNLRHTVLGGLILGEVFLWGDMLSYTAGVAIGVVADRMIFKTA